ncbi:MAG TPA: four helix bundle protein [Chitinophagaceae bacterium]|nr:four helix bundle protein [Chitinophagaceae bacterium]
MSYKTLEIWILANELVVEIHDMSLKLPKFEMYEEGSQIRKSSKNIKATIVEGYGRKIYKAEYLKFLVYARASNDETRDHLENLYNTKSLQNDDLYQLLHDKIDILGKKIKNYYRWAEQNFIPSL